jgi:site-specific recombinase XerC
MSAPESLESLAESFGRVLYIEGKADRTLVLYGQSVRYFCAWLTAQGQPTDLTSLTRDNVADWLESLRRRRLSDGTVLTRWRGLRRFVNWLLAEGIIHTDPLAGLTVDKPEPPPVPVLSDEELTALVGACKGGTFNDLRDTVMIRLLIDGGLRVSELTGIDLKHIDLDTGTVQVTGKGERVRAAYFGAKTAVALDRYLRVAVATAYADDPALLLGERAAHHGRRTRTAQGERRPGRARSRHRTSAQIPPHPRA